MGGQELLDCECRYLCIAASVFASAHPPVWSCTRICSQTFTVGSDKDTPSVSWYEVARKLQPSWGQRLTSCTCSTRKGKIECGLRTAAMSKSTCPRSKEKRGVGLAFKSFSHWCALPSCTQPRHHASEWSPAATRDKAAVVRQGCGGYFVTHLGVVHLVPYNSLSQRP
jgi:hypothetical protein